ncbi:MAG TPA: tRNA (guanosine(46)-N7)-methyltransferase TrmB [Azoarcus taiwanensis]|uniref:tRNA (guanine-N(7)-)-methyltransferase n=1 Tax=Azoarcus taiwanensis TaxID=666964 RepID=A0A972FCJ1_9RHOO|nr:tRNA (guanosine(46)-N7)-methyltransferase TrmB [Azoarcus taiwanensis]NMG02777.1 tRNA (guanosine(46)-N7)-methyltransferase TrmB [Azoarcus taiwanensis]HRQ59300.1 tRNA (guanosine(46)-N7)-methyltransferase TrmB [Azoarcus taiwanensis]
MTQTTQMDAPQVDAEASEPARFSSRSIRSFVLRQGRMTAAQQRYLDEWVPKIGISYQPEPIDLGEVFGREAPRILEVGFGMGESTAAIAEGRPDEDFLAIEVHGPGVGNLCKLIAEKSLCNLRIMQHDAVEVMRDMIPEGALAGVHVFFPDPWHKKRHHKRRIIQAEFVKLVASRLAPGGYLHCATDWQEYAEWMLDILSAEPLLENTAADYAPRPAYRPLTKFEQRGLRLGHGVWDLVFRRR